MLHLFRYCRMQLVQSTRIIKAQNHTLDLNACVWHLQLSVEMWGTRTKSSVSHEEFLLLVLPADSLDSCRKLGGPSGGDDRPSSARVCMSGSDCSQGTECVRGEGGTKTKKKDAMVELLNEAIEPCRQSSADCQTNVAVLFQRTRRSWRDCYN